MIAAAIRIERIDENDNDDGVTCEAASCFSPATVRLHVDYELRADEDEDEDVTRYCAPHAAETVRRMLCPGV